MSYKKKKRKSQFFMITLFSGLGLSFYIFVLVATIVTSSFSLVNTAVRELILILAGSDATDLVVDFYTWVFWVMLAIISMILFGLMGRKVFIWRKLKNQLRA